MIRQADSSLIAMTPMNVITIVLALLSFATIAAGLGVKYGVLKTRSDDSKRKDSDIRQAMEKGFADINARIDRETEARERENEGFHESLAAINDKIAAIWRAVGTVEGQQKVKP